MQNDITPDTPEPPREEDPEPSKAARQAAGNEKVMSKRQKCKNDITPEAPEQPRVTDHGLSIAARQTPGSEKVMSK